MPSKAHAVQTSAHARKPVEKDLLTTEQSVGALRFMGRVMRDAQLAQRPAPEGTIPVVTFDMDCHLGAVHFTVHVEQPYSPATRAAAAAKALHCRKGALVEVDAQHLDVRLVLPFCNGIRVLEGATA